MPHPTSRYEPPRTLKDHARRHPFAARVLGVIAVSALLVPVAKTFDRSDTEVVRATGLQNAAMLPAAVIGEAGAGDGAGGATAAPGPDAGAVGGDTAASGAS